MVIITYPNYIKIIV